MVGLDGEEFFEDRGRLFAVSKRGIVVSFGGQQGERVEGGGFVIVGERLERYPHCVRICFGAHRVIGFFGVAVKRANGGNVGVRSLRGFLWSLLPATLPL